MSNTQKLPMVLYFRENISTVFMDGSHMNNRFGQAFAIRKRESDVGPYVHLGQFVEEVEKRAKGIMQKWNINIVEARGEALRLLFDELRK